MFEHVKENVASLPLFINRVFHYFIIATGVLLFGLIPGVVGFILVGNLILVEAAINSISLLGGLEPPYEINTRNGQFFIAVYSVFVDTIFALAVATLLSPVVHRVIHKMHVQTEND